MSLGASWSLTHRIFKVPTVCIEHVYVWNNTTIIVDEVLAHRIGLVPLNVDPALVVMKERQFISVISDALVNRMAGEQEQATDRNTIVFELKLTCERNPQAPKGSSDPRDLYINHELKASHLTWKPAGEQAEVFASNPPAPANPDIVLAKLRPGQQVHIELHAVKGVGKDHAKFTPVGLLDLLIQLISNSQILTATASYRLLPHVIVKKPIPPEYADLFKSCFCPGVVQVDPVTKMVSIDEDNLRKDSVSREVLRHPEFADSVELSRLRDFFLCTCMCVRFGSRR